MLVFVKERNLISWQLLYLLELTSILSPNLKEKIVRDGLLNSIVDDDKLKPMTTIFKFKEQVTSTLLR